MIAMRSSAPVAAETIASLRREIARIEGRPLVGDAIDFMEFSEPGRPSFSARRGSEILPFGLPGLDDLTGGGLRRAALHENRSDTTRDWATANGYAAAILARLATTDNRPILWIIEAETAREAGSPYGVGLDRFGLDSTRLLLVHASKPDEVLWVFEEALACRGLSAVLAEMRGNPASLDLTASRRVALRARENGVLGLLLRQSASADPGAALTRWSVAPLPAGTIGDFPAGIGRPAWRLALERNRRGRTGRIDVEWDHERRAFDAFGGATAFPAHSRSLAAPPFDRPALPQDNRPLVANLSHGHDFQLPREIQRRRLLARG
jgi:protein ImuA